MTQVTADLEYFRCDVCGTYFHKEIFCDHRRECKGKDSQELKKKEVQNITKALDEEGRNSLKEQGKITEVNTDSLTIEQKEKRQIAAMRRKVQDEYFKEEEAKEAENLNPEKMKALLEYLDE